MDFQHLKSPVPDGLNPIFFKKLWTFTKSHIFQLVTNFFNSGFLPKLVNNTDIVLIPKTNHLDTIRNLRPISLCNIRYKIITKLLVHKFRPLLCSLISPFQSSFLPGRRISDNIVVTQGILEYMHKHNKWENAKHRRLC